jgi:3-methyladenine DNA glycosylase AlkD
MIPHSLTAAAFIADLKLYQSDAEKQKIQRYFKADADDEFIGVKMGTLFELAKEYHQMPIAEIELLLESNLHEARAGAVSIMDKASRDKKIEKDRLVSFFELYIRRHDRINNWDLVDLGCLYMTGLYLFDRPRTILYQLAKSDGQWERRTAILSTCYFIRKNEVEETYKIATILLHDTEDLVNKATGWMLRFAGDKDLPRLIQFLDQHAATMPRITLRNAIEKFDKPLRMHYLGLKE